MTDELNDAHDRLQAIAGYLEGLDNPGDARFIDEVSAELDRLRQQLAERGEPVAILRLDATGDFSLRLADRIIDDLRGGEHNLYLEAPPAQSAVPETVTDEWPEALSDGLTIPCSYCSEIPRFDYILDDAIWITLVPKGERTGVVCLPCLDRLASRQGIRIASYVRKIEFTGTGATVRCEPTLVHEYGQEVCSGCRGASVHHTCGESPRAQPSPEYASENPLGGPASMLRTAAYRIEQGEDYYAVLADYGLSGEAQLPPGSNGDPGNDPAQAVPPPQPRSEAQGDGEKCDCCGRHYRAVYRVPNGVWRLIAPKVDQLGGHPEHAYGGLLCVECASERADVVGAPLYFDATPLSWPETIDSDRPPEAQPGAGPFSCEQYMVTPDRIVILEDGGVALEWQRSGEYIEAEICPGDETDAPRIEWMHRDKQGGCRHEYKQPGDGREACTWELDDPEYDAWVSACGVDWVFPEGSPSEANMRFCPNCGKPAAIAARAAQEVGE